MAWQSIGAAFMDSLLFNFMLVVSIKAVGALAPPCVGESEEEPCCDNFTMGNRSYKLSWLPGTDMLGLDTIRARAVCAAMSYYKG